MNMAYVTVINISKKYIQQSITFRTVNIMNLHQTVNIMNLHQTVNIMNLRQTVNTMNLNIMNLNS